jgi:hypothetical protein
MNVPWFPCIHEVGSEDVQWFPPPETGMMHIISNQPPEVVENEGRWNIPQAPQNVVTTNSEADQWDTRGTDIDSFIFSLAKEVVNVSHGEFGLLPLISKISMAYPRFLEKQDGQEDNLESRSRYRIRWWRKARNGKIPLMRNIPG